MGRRYIDCRNSPNGTQCSVVLSADTENELLEAMVQHCVSIHGYEDNAELREMIRNDMKEESPFAG